MRIKGKGKSILTRQRLPVLGSLFTGLLDEVSGAAAAYSIRLLRAGYSGGLVRVRAFDGTSDQGEADVLPDGNNEVSLSSSLTNRDSKAGSSGRDVSTLGELVDNGGANYDGFVSEWKDQSPNAKHATNTTGTEQPKLVNAGTFIEHLEYDGSDDYLNMPISANFNQITVFAWVKITNINGTQHWVVTIRGGNSGDISFGIREDNGTIQALIVNGNNNFKFISSSISQDTWAHLAVRWDNQDIYLFKNGVQVDKTDAVGSKETGNIGKKIGADDDGNRNWEGFISNVYIFDNLISNSKIQEIYNDEKNRF